MRLTIDQALQSIHRQYEGDVDYLEFEDEETQLRVEYLKDGIKDWGEKFPEKREQFYTLDDASDGDKLTISNTTIYDCPSNFIKHSGTVKIGDSIYLSYIDPSEIDKKLQDNASSYWYTVIGYPGAFQIRINPVPQAGSAINYDYFGEIAIPTTTTDLIPISRPLYAVYYTLNKIYKEDDAVQEEKYKKLMEEEERLERVALAKSPSESNRLIISGAGMGNRDSQVSNIQTGR